MSDALAGIAIAVHAVLDGRLEPHDLPGPLHDLWRDGFTAGRAAGHRELARANAAADHWYYVANNPEQARKHHAQGIQLHTVALNRQSTAERWAELDRIAAERAEAARA